MPPSNPILRGALTLLFTLHIVLVCAYVSPWPEHTLGLNELATKTLPRVGLRQKWNMFRKPNKWDKLLIHEGLRADGSTVELMPSNAAPEGWFVRWGYDRMTKTHNIVAFEKEPKQFTPEYADWLCRNAPDDVVGVRLTKRAVKHRSRKQWAKEPPPEMPVKDTVVWEQACP